MKPLARNTVTAAAGFVVAAGLTGCQTSPGAAALVGGFRISTETLQHEVDHALADPQAQASLGGNRADFTRTELGRLISNRIIVAAAAAHHVTVAPSDIDAQIQAFAQQAGGMDALLQSAAQGGVPKDELRAFTRYYVLEQKLGDALVADTPVSRSQLQAAYEKNIDQYDQVHSAHILVKDKKTADMILAKVRKDPKQFASLAAQYSQDTSNKNQGGDLGFAGRGQFVPEFSNAIFAAKPGSFIEVHSQFGWHVVHVIAHTTKTLAEVSSELKTTILKDLRDRSLADALTAEADKLGVHVNPRYGRWDPSQAKVVPVGAAKDVSSPSPKPAG